MWTHIGFCRGKASLGHFGTQDQEERTRWSQADFGVPRHPKIGQSQGALHERCRVIDLRNDHEGALKMTKLTRWLSSSFPIPNHGK